MMRIKLWLFEFEMGDALLGFATVVLALVVVGLCTALIVGAAGGC